jgi:hypothetical protein
LDSKICSLLRDEAGMSATPIETRAAFSPQRCCAIASITLSGNLLKVIDSLAGAAQRSAWIERAVQSYAARQLKEQRRERELALLNRHADALNAEGDDSASYQAHWTAE